MEFGGYHLLELDRFGGMIYLGENGQGILRSKERSLYPLKGMRQVFWEKPMAW